MLFHLFLVSSFLASPSALAQLYSADKGRVIYGHHHINTQNLDAHKRFWLEGLGGAPCYCGANGCVESFISGGGLEKRIQDKTGNTITAIDFFKTSLKDESLKKIKQDFYAHFGQALANLINILDPDIVVLGGGLSNEESLYKEGVDEVYARIFNDIPTTPIVKNMLGDSAGVIGAALIGRGLIQ